MKSHKPAGHKRVGQRYGDLPIGSGPDTDDDSFSETTPHTSVSGNGNDREPRNDLGDEDRWISLTEDEFSNGPPVEFIKSTFSKAGSIPTLGGELAHDSLQCDPETSRNGFTLQVSPIRNRAVVAGAHLLDSAEYFVRLVIPDFSTPQGKEIPLDKLSLGVRRLLHAYYMLPIRKYLRSGVKAGYQRIEWTCSCGEALYGDFSNENPLAIDSLETVLGQMVSTSHRIRSDTPVLDRHRFELDMNPTIISQESRNHADMSKRHDRTSSSISQVDEEPISGPAETHELRTSSGIEHKPSNTSPSSAQMGEDKTRIPPAPMSITGGSLSRNQLPGRDSSSPALVVSGHETKLASENAIRPKFFELCVNHSRWQRRLGEINTAQCSSDGQVFAAIKSKYLALRKSKKDYFLAPVEIRYVRFSIQQNLIVGIFSKPDETVIPPKVEVDERRYEYQPCPLLDEPPMPSNVFIHHLTSDSPEAHPYSIWTSRLPKKIDDSIYLSKQPMTLGWGVHVVEGVDQIKVPWITICGILASCTATGLWWGLKKDISGGTGLGSLMLTMLGLMIAYSIVTERYG